jgi:hypothetical protein
VSRKGNKYFTYKGEDLPQLRVRLTESEYKEFVAEAKRRGVKHQKALTAAIAMWIASPKDSEDLIRATVRGIEDPKMKQLGELLIEAISLLR